MMNGVGFSNLSLNNIAKYIKSNAYLSREDIESLKQQPAKLNLDGTIYSANSVNTDNKTQNELKNEEIAYKKSSKGSQIVVFDSPSGKKEPVVLELSSQAMGMLEEKFGKKDLFIRDDGMIRLNGDAQKYVASWYNEISQKRGYGDADRDKNGIIDVGEKGNLRVGFERDFEYDYMGEKVVSASSYINGSTYIKYSDTLDAMNENTEGFNSTKIFNQALNFEDTIEKELDATIKKDKDFDRVVTLKEGLEYDSDGEENLYNKLIDETNTLHRHYIDESSPVLDENSILSRKIGGYRKPDEEEFEQLDILRSSMIHNAIKIDI